MISTIAYPFVFALFPVLSLYLRNYNEVLLEDVIGPLLFLLVLTLAIYLGSLIPTRNVKRASLITFVFIFFIFSFGPVVSGLAQIITYERLLSVYFLFFTFWLALLLSCVFFAVANTRLLVPVNKFSAFLAYFLVSTTLIRLILLAPWEKATGRRGSNPPAVLSETDREKAKDLPDIYYIIMDRYLRDDILQNNYGFDNSAFIKYLEDKGFYVARKSRSNYLKTAHSLASSLNMKYINYLSESEGENSDDWSPIYKLIKENEVVKELKSKGYKYIHFGSWWGPTRKNNNADVNINLNSLSEFSDNLFQNTIFFPLKDEILADGVRREGYERTIYELGVLGKVPLIEGPTFTFAHLLITHLPYVFDKEGNYLTPEEEKKLNQKDLYIVTVQEANKDLEKLVDKIFSESERRPIIVIQSDEGNYPQDISQFDHKYNWFTAPYDKVDEKTAILNAIYIPDIDQKIFYPTMTPVNTFRIVFNKVFNANMELLPDESYLHQDNFHLYKFKKIDQ